MSDLAQLHGRRVLMVYAHCDDELVCGWPVLQNPAITKEILIVSSDQSSAEREWCSHRKQVSEDLFRSLGIKAKILRHDSDFYRTDHRSGALAAIEKEIRSEVQGRRFDVVMTHNPFGEYGHMDHKLLWDLMTRIQPTVLTTDIVMKSDWTDCLPDRETLFDRYRATRLDEVRLDSNFYLKVQRFYETRGAWTWSTPPLAAAGVFQI